MKQELLQMLAAGREREAELANLCADQPARADGRWTAKDQLAHLVYWRLRNARLLEAVRSGGDLPPPVDDDEQNAIVYAENRDRPAADIKKDANASWSAMASFVEACAEDDLLKPHPYAPEYRLWETVTGDVDHLVAHCASFYLESGKMNRAEAILRWAYGVARDVLSEPAPRAYSAYNLGCLFARTSRAEEAVAMFRESFEAKPALMEHARQDPDLDPLRGNPELTRLLGG
jgi:tetratricopeptide (TPR) repeat protein